MTDAKEIIGSALEAVRSAGMSEHEFDVLAPIAFEKAIDIEASSAGVVTSSSQDGAPEAQEAEGGRPDDAPPDHPLRPIAEQVGLSVDEIEYVYQVVGGELQIMVPTSRIAETKAEGSRQLALLLAGGRQVLGIEDYTPLSDVRDLADEYSRLDSGNFAAAVGELEDEARERGSPRKREIRLTRPGLDTWRELVRSLATDENGSSG